MMKESKLFHYSLKIYLKLIYRSKVNKGFCWIFCQFNKLWSEFSLKKYKINLK